MLRSGLTRHLSQTYVVMMAIVLFSAAFGIGAFAFIGQLGRLEEQTRDVASLFAARADHVGEIRNKAQISSIVAGTYHPGWELNVVSSRVRYAVRWSPNPVVDDLPRYPDTPQALLLGTHLPARIVVNGVQFTLFPVGSVERIAGRTFGLTGAAALVALFFLFFLAERMAYETVRPLLVVRQALQTMAEGEPAPHHLPESGSEEFRDLIATYNRAIDAASKAQRERDAAEHRTHQFIADAGHQLRTPLTVLSGFIGILRKGQLRHPDDGPKILQKMDQQIAIIRKLVERLMLLENWHSAEEPICEVTDVGKFVASVVEPIASSNPDVQFEISSVPDATAWIDAGELTHAVVNIVANAIKYAPDGLIAVSVAADDNHIYITIADEGPGIPPESLPHVFDRFYRGSRRDVPGSGLGLAIAKVVIERAQGTVAVDSEPGNGARFTITLPRYGARTAQAIEASAVI